MDEITEAVLCATRSRTLSRRQPRALGDAARERVISYLEELRTTQRYELYRALEYPLYPILRKIERVGENTGVGDRCRGALSRGLRLEPSQPH